MKTVVICVAIAWCLFCAKSCGDCWNQGGQPVNGVVGIVCVK